MIQQINDFFAKHNLKPFMTIYLALVHLYALVGMAYMGIYTETLLKSLGLVVFFHGLYALGITAGCHRLWAHKAYHAGPLLRFFLMLLNSGSNQGSIYHWSRDHRMHHKFSDTSLDPHDMSRGFFFAHMGWLLEKKSAALMIEGEKVNMKDLEADWVVMFQKKYNWFFVIMMCWAIPGYAFHHFTGSGIIMSFCLANLPYVTSLHATWCVNSICHMFGTRPWNKNILPADNIWVALITAGEGYHNWHHEYPSDWRGSKDHWYMLNFTARFLEVCSLLRLCKLKA